jgi:hypothetical protein
MRQGELDRLARGHLTATNELSLAGETGEREVRQGG